MSLDDLQAQLRGALDQQLAALKQHYEDSLAEARRDAAAEAAQMSAAQLDAARNEAKRQAIEMVKAQRQALEKEFEQQLTQTVDHAIQSVKRGAELQLESERRKLENAAEAARQSLQQELESERERAQRLASEHERAQQELESARASARQELEAARERAEQDLQKAREQLQEEFEFASARSQQDFESAREQARLELDAERARAQQLATEGAHIEAERARLESELAVAQERAQSELDELKQQTEAKIAEAVAAIPAPPPPARAPDFAAIAAGLCAVDAATSLSQILESVLRQAGTLAGRAALFLIDGDRLKAWKSVGIPDVDVQTVESSISGRDLLGQAIQQGHAIVTDATVPPPAFARLPADRGAIAAPLMITGRAVAVLYADAGTDKEPSPGWTGGVDLLVRHAAAMSALRAAMRTLDVLGGADPAAVDEAPAGNGNGEESARRFARLLVSEIKLYNEGAVRVGRERKDLMTRLHEEIGRAQRLYEERVPPAVASREAVFRQELVQTLADGDPTLLGN